jgi:hypothetical protein
MSELPTQEDLAALLGEVARDMLPGAAAKRFLGGAAIEPEDAAQLALGIQRRLPLSIPADDLPNLALLEDCLEYLALRLGGMAG